MLYSQDLERFTGKLPLTIQEGITETEEITNNYNLDIYKLDDKNIAVTLNIEVNLPSKGTHENIDIRANEPILLSFNLNGYPTTSPRIKSDRKDFPTDKLSHLYVVKTGIPPTLCLVRENLDEWFANRRLSDLILVGKQWFSKAANGLLSEDGNEFEPIRLEGYRGYSIYRYKKLADIIINNHRYIDERPFTYIIFNTKDKNSYNPTFKWFNITLSSKNFKDYYKIIAEINIKSIKSKSTTINYFLYGLLIWSNNPEPILSYSTTLPKTYGELESFAKGINVSIRDIVQTYINNGLFINNLTSFIPIIIAIKRPKKLIGFETNIELLHFVIKLNDDLIIENNINPEAEVFFQSHREPISSHLAQKLSLNENQAKTIFIGAGALGSKLLLHFARGGNFNLKAIDNDRFSPHNIVRHDLFMDSSGENKAKAVIEKVKSFLDENETLEFYEGNIFNYDRKLLTGYDWLIDTSASLNVQNWLVNNNLYEISNIARAEIAFKGILGFLYIEGIDHNPRIDDLINYVYYLGTKDKIISEWLIEENKKLEGNDYDIVDIGIGCNSPTVVMPNDSMSFHASIFSKILNNENSRSTIGSKGLLHISYLSQDGFEINSRSYLIGPLLIFKCQNRSGWEIRIVSKILDKMKFESTKYKRKETGGIFIGICNYKTKTIHVFDTIVAPKDSKRSSVYFYRGIENLPEQVKYIKEITGNMIGYIGEWHTHPMGLDSLSEIDHQAVENLKPLNEKYPIPTFISILSKEKYLPFVF